MKRRITAVVLIMLLLLSAAGCGGQSSESGVKKAREQAADYLLEKVAEPAVGSIGGEWTVIGLVRGNAEVPDGYYDAYYDNVRAAVKSKAGVLNERRYTDYARVSIALAAIGKDPAKVEGYDLIKPLERYKKVVNQGINGPVFALIAANSSGYDLKTADRYLKYIMKAELKTGGFSLEPNADKASPDLTAMVLQALAFYKDDSKVSSLIDRTVKKMAELQKKDGTFDSSSETVSQMIIGLTAIGIDPLKDERFIKADTNLYDVLMTYENDGGFCHQQGKEVNLMATEQALCALDALQLCGEGGSLYKIKE